MLLLVLGLQPHLLHGHLRGRHHLLCTAQALPHASSAVTRNHILHVHLFLETGMLAQDAPFRVRLWVALVRRRHHD